MSLSASEREKFSSPSPAPRPHKQTKDCERNKRGYEQVADDSFILRFSLSYFARWQLYRFVPFNAPEARRVRARGTWQRPRRMRASLEINFSCDSKKGCQVIVVNIGFFFLHFFRQNSLAKVRNARGRSREANECAPEHRKLVSSLERAQ